MSAFSLFVDPGGNAGRGSLGRMVCRILREYGHGGEMLQLAFCCSSMDKTWGLGLEEHKERRRSVSSLSCSLAGVTLSIFEIALTNHFILLFSVYV